jgi:hypothetical protein
MIELRCGKWVNLEAGATCQLPADHAGECRVITWRELQRVFDEPVIASGAHLASEGE